MGGLVDPDGRSQMPVPASRAGSLKSDLASPHADANGSPPERATVTPDGEPAFLRDGPAEPCKGALVGTLSPSRAPVARMVKNGRTKEQKRMADDEQFPLTRAVRRIHDAFLRLNADGCDAKTLQHALRLAVAAYFGDDFGVDPARPIRQHALPLTQDPSVCDEWTGCGLGTEGTDERIDSRTCQSLTNCVTRQSADVSQPQSVTGDDHASAGTT